MAGYIYQKDIIDASQLRQIASRDVCYRVVRKLVTDGKIVRHHDKTKKNSLYFTEPHARIVKEALDAEAQRRLSSLESGAADPVDPGVAHDLEQVGAGRVRLTGSRTRGKRLESTLLHQVTCGVGLTRQG